jgi:hypothetical protein
MTKNTGRPVLELVNNPTKPKSTSPKKSGNGGGGSGSGTSKQASARFGNYAIIDDAFYQIKIVERKTEGGITLDEIQIPLCDFTCRITSETLQDDGMQDIALLRIDGVRRDGKSLAAVDVPAAKFFSNQGSWVNEFYGTAAFVYPGASRKDNLRAAIQLYSQLEGDVPQCKVFKYTGWKRIDDRWHYLTGTGAITDEGLIDAVQVDLGEGHMSRYVLPVPLTADQLKPAFASILDLLNICPAKPQIGAALLTAVARAPLGECHPTDFCLFLQGVTGSKKSSIAAVALAFFGEFNARRFPANWSDTDNDMEAKAFAAKDGIFVIDDFKPSVNQTEASKLHTKSERFFRNTGNQAGRGRRHADMKSRRAPFNRSMTISTGEDLPKGQSILGRLLVLELTRADVDTHPLTRLQQAADDGQLAGIMAAYIQWLCTGFDERKKTFSQSVMLVRNEAIRNGFASSHPRAPEIYANLVAGADLFMTFLTEAGVISLDQNSALLLDIETHLKSAFSEQATYQQEQDETERFLELLRALFSSGNAHIACRLNQGPPPSRPFAWGWRSDAVDAGGDKIYKPMGDCIGWYCDKQREVWLEQNAAFAAVQTLARSQGDAFLISAASLWRRMGEKGLILATETRSNGTKQYAVKRVIGGRSRRVMVLAADLVESE